MTIRRQDAAGGRRGAILILVLIALAGVAVLGSMMIREVAVEYTTASAARATVSCNAALDSAMLLATNILMQDKGYKDGVDSFNDDWAHFTPTVEGMGEEWEGVSLTGRILDENGRFPINAMLSNDEDRRNKFRKIFVRLVGGLLSIHGLTGDPAVLAENLRHWGIRPSLGSVPEDAWYSAQKPPYQRPGKLFRYPEEILLVHWPGVDQEAFKKFFYGSDQRPGLRDFITVFNQTTININTAPPGLLKAICPPSNRSDGFVQAALAYRSTPGHVLSGLWHKRIAMELGIDMTLYPEECLSQTSAVYRIELEARKGLAVRRFMSVVTASDTKCVVLFQRAS